MATLFAALCRICLTFSTYGTNDASMWESSASVIRQTGGRAIYQHRIEVHDPDGKFLHNQIFNHPPFIVFVLAGLNRLSDVTGIPVRSSLRLLDTIADAATVFLTAAILERLLGSIPLLSMILVALSPSWMFISGFHVNTDPLMVFFLVLAVYMIEVQGHDSWGFIAFTLSTGIKIVPVLLLPALLFYIRTWSFRIKFIAIFTAFWLVTAFPWILASPSDLLQNLLGYRSMTGQWGLSFFYKTLQLAGFRSVWWFNVEYPPLLPLCLLTATWFLSRAGKRISLFYQFGFLLFLFHLVTPGFGIQYLAWLTPWIAALPWPVAGAYIATSGAFATAVYTYWSRGIPWYYANSVTIETYHGLTSFLGVSTWFAVGLAVTAYSRRFNELGFSWRRAVVETIELARELTRIRRTVPAFRMKTR